MELNSNREQGYFEGGRRVGTPVIGAGGGLLPQTKTVLPRPFWIPTFVGRTVEGREGRGERREGRLPEDGETAGELSHKVPPHPLKTFGVWGEGGLGTARPAPLRLEG